MYNLMNKYNIAINYGKILTKEIVIR